MPVISEETGQQEEYSDGSEPKIKPGSDSGSDLGWALFGELRLAFPNFGTFAQYLTESKVPSRGPSQFYLSENAIMQNIS